MSAGPEDLQKTHRGCTVGSVQGPRVSQHQGLEAGAWDIALEGCCCCPPALVAVGATAVGATARHRGAGLLQHRCAAAAPWTHKAGRDIKGANASAVALSSSQLPACSEPYVHTAPQALLEKSFVWSGAGWAQRFSRLSWQWEPAQRKGAEVMRAEEYLAHQEGLY